MNTSFIYTKNAESRFDLKQKRRNMDIQILCLTEKQFQILTQLETILISRQNLTTYY